MRTNSKVLPGEEVVAIVCVDAEENECGVCQVWNAFWGECVHDFQLAI